MTSPVRRLAPRALLPALLVIFAPAAHAGESFLVVTPQGPGNQSQAQGFLADFEKALAAGWPTPRPPEIEGHYHVTEADALIAYLQLLGTQVDFKLYDDKANIR